MARRSLRDRDVALKGEFYRERSAARSVAWGSWDVVQLVVLDRV